MSAGRARVVFTAMGGRSEVGAIASMTAGAREPATPRAARIAQFGHSMLFAPAALFGAVLALARGTPLSDVMLVAIRQVVSLVPEGLPVAMTIALAVGMQRMASREATMLPLSALETLGALTGICIDKTGTLAAMRCV